MRCKKTYVFVSFVLNILTGLGLYSNIRSSVEAVPRFGRKNELCLGQKKIVNTVNRVNSTQTKYISVSQILNVHNLNEFI